MSWVYVPVSADSSSACRLPSQVLTQFASLRQTNSVSAFLPNTGQTCLSGATCSLLTPIPGQATSMLLQRDSPASPGVTPETSSAPRMNATCSQPLRKSFAWWDQSSFSWRTFQGSLLEADYPLFSDSWPRWGSLRNGESFPSAPWAPAIYDGVSSSSLEVWPTPKACNADKGGRPRQNDRGDLCAASKGWPTPVACSSGGNKSQGPNAQFRPSLENINRLWQAPLETDATGSQNYADGTLRLTGQVKQSWPTATATDFKSGRHVKPLANSRPLREVGGNWPTSTASDATSSGSYGNGSMKLGGAASGHLDRTTTGQAFQPFSGRLNSAFVEWLMGFPYGWTDWTAGASHESQTESQDLELWATRLAHLLRQWVGQSSATA